MGPIFLEVRGGHLAVSHRPRKSGMGELRQQGCTWVVSVLGRREQPFELGEAVSAAGLGWVWLELGHGRAPSGQALRKLWRQVLLDSGERVLLHCSAGQHRTGMVTYMLLRMLGYERVAAVGLIERLRPATREGLEQAGEERFVEPDLDRDAEIRVTEPGLFGRVQSPARGATGSPS